LAVAGFCDGFPFFLGGIIFGVVLFIAIVPLTVGFASALLSRLVQWFR